MKKKLFARREDDAFLNKEDGENKEDGLLDNDADSDLPEEVAVAFGLVEKAEPDTEELPMEIADDAADESLDDIAEAFFFGIEEKAEEIASEAPAEEISAEEPESEKASEEAPEGDLQGAAQEATQEATESENHNTCLSIIDELDAAAPAQLGEKLKETRSGKRTAVAVARLIIIAALLCVIVYSGAMIVSRFFEYDKSQSLYDRLAEQFDSETACEPLTAVLDSPEDDVSLPDFTNMILGNFEYKQVVSEEEKRERALYRTKINSLAKINPEIYGWINIPGTNINYPIVLGDDNDRYISYDFYGNESSLGAIFADFRAYDNILDNKNLVIYGHNIRTKGVMFNHLLKYQDKEFFDKNEYIYIYTTNGYYKYKVFAFYQTSVEFNYTKMYFPNDSDLSAFVSDVAGKSMFKREGMNYSGEQIITLSTCTNGEANERYALHAVLCDYSEF